MIQSEVRSNDSSNAWARRQALASMATVPVLATGIVSFAASGRVLVIGDDDGAIEVARDLPSPLTAIVVVLDASEVPPPSDGIVVLTARSGDFVLDGHLGDFRARLQRGGNSEMLQCRRAQMLPG